MNDKIYTDSGLKDSAIIKRQRRLTFYIAALSALILISTALGVIITLFCVDGQTGYFTPSIFTTLFFTAMAISAALSISAFIIFDSKALSLSSRVRALPLRLMYILPSAAVCICFYAIALQEYRSSPVSAPRFPTLAGSVGSMIFAAAFLLCIMYSISHIFQSFNKSLKLISGIMQIALCLYIMITLYFDLSVELNSPFKVLIQFSAATLAISTCMELRDLTTGVSIRAFIAAKALLCAISVPTFAVTICSEITEISLKDQIYPAYSLFFIACAICSAVELCGIKFSFDNALNREGSCEVGTKDGENPQEIHEQCSSSDNEVKET